MEIALKIAEALQHTISRNHSVAWASFVNGEDVLVMEKHNFREQAQQLELQI